MTQVSILSMTSSVISPSDAQACLQHPQPQHNHNNKTPKSLNPITPSSTTK